MCLKLISIFPDYSLPVLQTQILFSLSHFAVIFPCHCHSHRLLRDTGTASQPPFSPHSLFSHSCHIHSSPYSLSHLLPLWLHTFSVVDSLLSSWLNQAQAQEGSGIGTRVAVAANGSQVGCGNQSCNRKKQDTVVKRTRISTLVASAGQGHGQDRSGRIYIKLWRAYVRLNKGWRGEPSHSTFCLNCLEFSQENYIYMLHMSKKRKFKKLTQTYKQIQATLWNWNQSLITLLLYKILP